MKLVIPDSLEEITLAEIQEISKVDDILEQAKVFFNTIVKKDASKFDDTTIIATLQTALNLWQTTISKEAFKEIGEYKLPKNLMDIRVGHLIELANIEVDQYEGLELIAGCLYRKDWNKKFNSDEIIETAYAFRDMGADKALSASIAYNELMVQLRDTFPVLYSNKNEEKEEGRKMYSMLLGLSKDDATKWDAAKNIKVADAFIYLETKEIEFQKQKQKQGYI